VTARRALLGLALGAALAACAAPPPPAPLTAVVEGCQAFASDGACEHTPGTALRIFVDAAGAATVTVDDAAVVATATVVDTGRRFGVPLPADAKRLRLAVPGAAFALELRPVATATPTDPGRRGARAELDRGRRRLREGRLDAVMRHLDAAIAQGRAARDLHVVREAAFMAVHLEVSRLGALPQARARLAQLPEPPEVDGRARILTAFYRGLLAGRMLDARTARDAFAAAARWSQRLDSPLATYVIHERARMLMDLGRAREAAAVFDALLPKTEACVRAGVATSAGWARLVARPRFELPKARALLEEALAAYTGPCAQVPDANNVRVNLAFLAVETDPAEARRRLAEVEGVEQPEARAWRHALLGRLSLTDYPQAKLHFTAAADEARRLGHEILAWQAQLGLGQAAEAQGNLREALARYRAAEQVLDRQSLLVPVNGGQQFLLEDKDESQRRLVGALLAAGEPRQALLAAREARRRSVAALAARDALAGLRPDARAAFADALARFEAARGRARDAAARAWQVPAAEAPAWEARRQAADAEAASALDAALLTLASAGADRTQGVGPPAPSPGALWVLPYPLLAPGRVFVARDRRVEVHPLPEGEAAWGALLAPELPGIRRVVVFDDPGAAPHGPETAQVAGAPLVTRLPVTYTLDLSRPAARTSSAAVVVFDPRGDLADARREGRWVTERLTARGLAVRSLGPREATAARVLSALEGAALFHYAGHGRFDPEGGWGSALLLYDGALELGDLITLPSPPHAVILTGCDTASTQAGRAAVGLGVAQALLAAGSAEAVATRAPVPSGEARAFAEVLYRALGENPDLGQAFAAARAERAESTRFVLLSRSTGW
jgi:tetratricopeptide (TPR) repeat protein